MQQITTPLTVFLLGATGDLSRKKILKSLYTLAQQNLLPAEYCIIGNSRKKMTHAEFATFAKEHVEPKNAQLWKSFASRLRYVPGSLEDAAVFSEMIKCADGQNPGSRHLWYAATIPKLYTSIITNLGTTKSPSLKNTKFVLEKPFGTNTQSAQELSSKLLSVFSESQIHLVDHYLGKETVQNILAFRFGNGIFEHIWNKDHIAAIQVQAPEQLGVDGRESFYDATGVTRDYIQNHILQMFATTMMDVPSVSDSDAIRDKRQKLLDSLYFDAKKPMSEQVVLGQYTGGIVNGAEVTGYKELAGIPKKSRTETAIAGRICSRHPNWKGVPLFFRAGKRLEQSVVEISVVFKNMKDPFYTHEQHQQHNVLTFRMQPNEGIVLKLHAKKPGITMDLTDVSMSFCYKDHFDDALVGPYVKLLYDVLTDTHHLFARTDGIISSWETVEPILEYQQQKSAHVHEYPAGSFGPKAFHTLIEDAGFSWIEPTNATCSIETVLQ